jgi:hypothetical protein
MEGAMERLGSYVNCPECGTAVKFILYQMEGEELKKFREMEKGMDLEAVKRDIYISNGKKCKCGKNINVLMAVNAE